MALAFPHTDTLLDTSAAPLTGGVTSPWFAAQINDGRTVQTLQVYLISGTVTSITVFGRIDENSPSVQLSTGAVTAATQIARYRQLQVVVVGGVAAAIRVQVDKPVRQTA